METILSIFSLVKKFPYGYIMKSYNYFSNFGQEVLKIAQREINEPIDSSIFKTMLIFHLIYRTINYIIMTINILYIKIIVQNYYS